MARGACAAANAGLSTATPSLPETPSPMYHELLRVSLPGAFYTLREAVAHMVRRAEAGDGGGSLITCGSAMLAGGLPTIEHYAAAKGGLLALTRSMAVPYGRYRIRANKVPPGLGATDPGRASRPPVRPAAP